MGSDIEFLLKVITTGSRVLSTRLLLILTLLMTFGLFAWAMAEGDLLHLAIAACFAVIVFLPVKSIDAVPKQERTET